MSNSLKCSNVLPLLLLSICCTILCCTEPVDKADPEGSQQDGIEETEDWTLTPFVKVDSVNPIMSAGGGKFFCPILKRETKWEDKDVFNPAVIPRNGKIYMLYRAEDKIGKFAGTSRVGLAESTDGLHFLRHPEPVLFPDNDEQKKYEWEGGCEDPRVVEGENGMYVMTYTSYDGDKARLMVASSPDLVKWKKHGPAFANAPGGKYLNTWSKSGSIVSRYGGGKILATRINGKYWMYWGDVNIWAATSNDLVTWSPVEMQKDEKSPVALKYHAATMPDLKIVLAPRKGMYDSDIIEPGPPAMLTENGILLLYNCRNIPSIGDTSLKEGTYTVSQVLMDKQEPTKVLKRMNTWFMQPDKDFEIKGQINEVCFAEGLVPFNNRWFLYYGTADSKIAVAVKSNL